MTRHMEQAFWHSTGIFRIEYKRINQNIQIEYE